MKFSSYDIAPEVKKSLNDLGFKKPTDIQYKSIPAILRGEDVLAIAQTGTGKTAAFAIPVIHKLYQKQHQVGVAENILCLVMVPTHELAIQIHKVFDQLAAYTNLRILSIYGGTSQDAQIKTLQTGVDILIATPGRMFDLIKQGYVKITKVEILILDEADHMLDMGFINDIHDVIKFLPKKHQTLFFSATINTHIKDLAYSLVKNPIRIQISPKDPVSKNIDHAVAFISMDDKRFFLERWVKEKPESKILVFVRTKIRAERVHKAMERVGIASLTIHGDKDQNDRGEAMEKFRIGEIKILIATDVSARGIDIPNVAYVINYDLPDEPENYVHRIGRTGRGTSKGVAVSFCSPEEKEVLDQIQSFLGKEIKVLDISKDEYLATQDLSEDHPMDWKSLMKEAAQNEERPAKGFKKKKGK